jgi:hypothetical protein
MGRCGQTTISRARFRAICYKLVSGNVSQVTMNVKNIEDWHVKDS